MKSAVEALATKLLCDGNEMSKYDLAHRARCDQRTAQKILKRIHGRGDISIVDWVPIYTKKIPVYGMAKADVQKPAPVPMAEIQARRRKDPDVRAKEAAIKRNDRTRRKYGIHTPKATLQSESPAMGRK